MIRKSTIPVVILTLLGVLASSLQARQHPPQPFSGQFIEVKQYSDAENEVVVIQFDGLRTTGVAMRPRWVDVYKVTVMERQNRPMRVSYETKRGSP